ncbi:uncharacterized protein LOC131427320 [Malaya genurostris]|uniref:uncharacterized protein LOC131427320 n=1 Tax=Malaya genurostris TaxID=325434 RepID=UPI0026F400C6|nr:uncharacterized protein LOC131427320 [Malaya genurostris]
MGDKEIVKQLREKPVFYVKADKGNKVVIMDKEDYDNLIIKKINDGPYRKQRADPLPDIIKKVDKTLHECNPNFDINLSSLKVSNPSLSKIKGLPKVHKPGNEIREIISSVGAPTQKISKWLVKEFQSMPKKFFSKSVPNTQAFVTQLQNSGESEDDEMMVSFDVTALFPSVPVKDSINLLEDWLLQQNSSSLWKCKVRSYLTLTRLCMDVNYFKFRGKFYKQLQGAPMGNPLSPFLCVLFMANLEELLNKQGLLPNRWWRYVDDIFCIIKRNDLSNFLEIINNLHKNIKFTYEEEKDNSLPFLDILIVREAKSLTFEIYRKPTNTDRVIPNTSNHPHQHKMAAFHHMIHRMLSLPLRKDAAIKEKNFIFEIGKFNGYPEHTIQTIFDKKLRLLKKQSLTTLTLTSGNFKRISVDFNQNISHPLKSKLRKFVLDLVFSSMNYQLKTLLGSTKDPTENLKKSGVYKISCPHCDKIYIGQTKRTLDIRFKEHISEIAKASKELEKGLPHHFKSKVAEHAFFEDHELTTNDIKILRQISNPWKLDSAESLEIFKNNSISFLNRDQGNRSSWLFQLLPISKIKTNIENT